MRRVRVDPAEATTDLTPIIDVVFNLIIFFMIASELNERRLEQLRLPFADRARPAQTGGRGARVLQVNVLADGAVKLHGRRFALAEGRGAGAPPGRVDAGPPLAGFLELEAAGYDREPPVPGSTGLPPSALHINVRADRDVPFGRVQGVLDACVDQGIYRTSLGADPAGP